MLEQLRQVAIFAKTVEHGSFRGAARELRLSPSVVSHHISQLEEHLGVALLYRSTRKLAMTRDGEQLLASTSPMLEAIEGAFSNLSSSADRPIGELHVTTPSVLIQSHLTDLLALFSMKYPGIKLFLDYSDVRQDLIDDGYDIAIRMGIRKTKNTAVERKLFQVKRCLIASRSYLKGRQKVTNPEELMSWDWLELAPVQHIKPNFRKSKSESVTIKPKAHITANDALALFRLAYSGAGLAVVPKFLVEDAVAAGAVEYVLPEWELAPIEVFAAWPSNAPKHGLIKLFLSEISSGVSP